MKKYTFTLLIEEVTVSNTVNNILEKVKEEKRIEALIEQNNNFVIREMQKVLEVIHADLTELLQPLDLKASSHFRERNFIGSLNTNSFGKFLDIQIGGRLEHYGVKSEAVFVRLYCPFEDGRLIFKPNLVMFSQDTWMSRSQIPFTTSENLIDTYSDVIEKMYRNNLKS
jgi:hypothetical protein